MPDEARPAPLPLVALLFVISGAAGLVDQVCFSKYLSYVVGSTAHAVSAVLAAFMAGLALGAAFAGRLASRARRPLVAYGVLEVVAGLAVMLTPFAFSALGPAYVALVRLAPGSIALVTVARWLCSVLVVVVPTTAMGATLPLLSRLVEDRDGARARGRALGVLYAANTLGGAVGSLACAYVVVPSLGLRASTLVAGVGSVLVGLAAIALGRRTRAASSQAPVAAERATDASPDRLASDQTPDRVLDVVAFASGALVFACEVLFVHLLVLLVGTSAYAFGVILSIFLVCLFFGAGLAPVVHRLAGRASLPLGLAAAALALTGTLGVWEGLPAFFKGVGGDVSTFEGREVVRGTAAFMALAGPTTLMGLSFPLLLQHVAPRPDVGRLVGRLTAVNTVGSVVGSLATGYLVLPALGSQRSLIAVAGAFAVVALVVAVVVPAESSRGRLLRGAAALASVAGVGLGLAAPRWDLAEMTGGYHVYFDTGRGPERIVSVAEDTHGGVTTVTEKDGVHTLLTNGKFQGNDGGEVHAQRFFAHYPSMFVPRFGRALCIGLGTGNTVGTLSRYPYERLDVVEISPAIVAAARTYFGPIGAAALDDPRVSLYLEDGRNHLTVSDATYDLVGIELTSVWFAGAGGLYSREFYQLVKQRLAPDGVLQQWIQLHHITPRDFATVVHTLRLEFEHVALFYGGGQGILVSSNAPLVTSKARLDALEPTLGDARPSRPLASLSADVLVTGEGLDAFLAEAANEAGLSLDAMVSTDDNLYLEYATPRGNVLPWSSREELVSRLNRHRDVAAIGRMVGP